MRPDPNGGSLADRFGKVVDRFRLDGDDLGKYEHVPPGTTLTCEQNFHGDHDTVWIVAREAGGHEVQRWNVRSVVTIIWAQR